MSQLRALRAGVSLLGVVASVAGFAERGPACDPTCAQLFYATPEGPGVPLNAELRVLYTGSFQLPAESVGCEPELTRLRLVPEGGEPLELSGTLLHPEQSSQGWVVARPSAPLAPNTRYDLQVRSGSSLDACDCEGREWFSANSFETGDAEDHVAPEFAGLQELTYGERIQGGESGCEVNDFFPAWPVPGWAEATDASTYVSYDVYVDGQLQTRFSRFLDGTPAWAELAVDCGSNAPLRTQLFPGSHVEVRAIDVAGNESPPNPGFDVLPDLCAGDAVEDLDFGEPEPELILPSPTASSPADVSVSRTKASGCALAPGAGGHAAAWALALVWALRRRRTTAARQRRATL